MPEESGAPRRISTGVPLLSSLSRPPRSYAARPGVVRDGTTRRDPPLGPVVAPATVPRLTQATREWRTSTPPDPVLTPDDDLQARSLRQRHHEQVSRSGRTRCRCRPEIPPDQEALALGGVVFSGVVGHAILEQVVVRGDPASVPGEVELEGVHRERRGGTNEQVALELRAESPPGPERRSRPAGTANFQLNSGSL
jgi:hypothetical protein